MLKRIMSKIFYTSLILAYTLLVLPGNAPAADVLKHYYAHDAVEDNAGKFTKKGLMDADEGAVQRARSDGDLGSTLGHGIDQLLHFFNGR